MTPSRRPPIATLVTFTLALASPSTAALADSPSPPYSYRQTSADRQFVFVMISPLPAEVDGDRWLSGPAGEVRAVRSTYPRSGMYRNDGSITPLWTVDWYAKRVDVASDGVHLVRHGPWASRTTDEALTVFANGAALRGYRVNELVDLPFLLPHSVSHFDWVDTEGFDDANMRYRVKTLDGNSFVFDVKSGQILSSSRRAWMRLSGAVLVVLLSVVAIVAFWRRLVARTASR